jgi:hypothetical protein
MPQRIVVTPNALLKSIHNRMPVSMTEIWASNMNKNIFVYFLGRATARADVDCEDSSTV